MHLGLEPEDSGLLDLSLRRYAESGSALDTEHPGGGMPSQASVALPAGRWRIRATHTKADEDSWVGLIQMLPIDS
ncbi:hypothetical protein AB0454_43865 [Streptomyces sp. NPDC093509]|uniref:hypothetical protein n=1 Tax=Streptomyces sp. NPDC093509 TaxID=3154982 RepID=UPI003450FE2D